MSGDGPDAQEPRQELPAPLPDEGVSLEDRLITLTAAYAAKTIRDLAEAVGARAVKPARGLCLIEEVAAAAKRLVVEFGGESELTKRRRRPRPLRLPDDDFIGTDDIE